MRSGEIREVIPGRDLLPLPFPGPTKLSFQRDRCGIVVHLRPEQRRAGILTPQTPSSPPSVCVLFRVLIPGLLSLSAPRSSVSVKPGVVSPSSSGKRLFSPASLLSLSPSLIHSLSLLHPPVVKPHLSLPRLAENCREGGKRRR